MMWHIMLKDQKLSLKILKSSCPTCQTLPRSAKSHFPKGIKNFLNAAEGGRKGLCNVTIYRNFRIGIWNTWDEEWDRLQSEHDDDTDDDVLYFVHVCSFFRVNIFIRCQ